MNQRTRETIDTAVAILREAGAQEVYLFGSAAEGRDTPDSDIDLAVRGLPPKSFFEAVGRVVLAISQHFDIVDLDDANPFTEYLARKGKLARVA